MPRQSSPDLGSTSVLFLGGRSGVGKTSVGNEIHAQLSHSDVRHCLIDGDMLDMAFPAPWDDHLAERNLAALWTNYRSLGYRRLVYVNTACVMAGEIDRLTAAMDDQPAATAILLSCSEETARRRLTQREVGSGLAQHLERSAAMATTLNDAAPSWALRLPTDGRALVDIAADAIKHTGWASTTTPGI